MPIKFQELKKSTINWIKNPSNLGIIGIFLLALIIRIYYFSITLNQPVWWDEADYLNIANSWSGDYLWEFNPLRPILLPLIFLFINSLFNGEFMLRFFIVISSVVSLIFFYNLTLLLFNKKISIYSTIIFGFFWSYLFYTSRLLVDVPLTMFWLGTIYFFFKGNLSKEKKYYLTAGIFLGLSFLMKFSSIVLVLIIFTYWIFSERKKLINNTNFYLFYISSFIIVLPYLIWQKIFFGSFFAFYNYARNPEVLSEKARPFLDSLINQTIFSIKIIDPTFFNDKLIYLPITLILLFIGLVYIIYKLILLPEKIIVPSSDQNFFFFILLWPIISLFFFGWLNYGDYMDERYYFIFYPSLFIIVGIGLSQLSIFIKKYHKNLSRLVILLLIALILLQNVCHSNQLIVLKSESYSEFKNAGEFIQKNSGVNDTILVNEEMAQYVYYSRRMTNSDGTIKNISDLYHKIDRNKPKYLVLSFYYYLNDLNQDKLDLINEVYNNDEKFYLIKSYGPKIDKDQKVSLTNIFLIKS